MNGGSREGTQKAISPSRCLSRLRTENSSDSDDLAKLLRGEDARWGGVSSPLLGYYMIIKTRRASAVIFSVTLHLTKLSRVLLFRSWLAYKRGKRLEK